MFRIMLRDIGRVSLGLAFILSLSFVAYFSLLGGGWFPAVLFVAACGLWVLTAGLGIASAVLRYRAIVSSSVETRQIDRSANRVMLLGYAFCALPVVWVVFATRVFSSSLTTSSNVVTLPAVAMLAVGMALVLFRVVALVRIYLRNPSQNAG